MPRPALARFFGLCLISQYGSVGSWPGVRSFFPPHQTKYPSSLSVLRSTGSSSCNMWNIVRWPRTCGYQPLMNEHRLGVQTGFWQKAFRNDTPSVRVMRSRFGVTAAGLPMCPSASPRHWSGLKITIFGCLLIPPTLLFLLALVNPTRTRRPTARPPGSGR